MLTKCQKYFLWTIYHLLGRKWFQNQKCSEFIELWCMWCFDIDIKNYFSLIFTTCSTQIGPKNKSAQDLLKFGTFHIWNMSISILMSKMIFIKSLQPFRPKLVPKIKILRIFWNLEHLIFRIFRSRLWCHQKKIFSIIYQLLGPNWS